MVNKLTILYVLEPFLFQPKEELHLSYLSKYFNEPHPTLRLKLNYLEEKGILKKTYKGRLTLYKINFNLPNIIDIITISEKIKLIKLSQENLIFREFINFLQTKFEEKNSIVIFGSFVENYKKANDIDILIIGKYNNKNIEDFIKK